MNHTLSYFKTNALLFRLFYYAALQLMVLAFAQIDHRKYSSAVLFTSEGPEIGYEPFQSVCESKNILHDCCYYDADKSYRTLLFDGK